MLLRIFLILFFNFFLSSLFAQKYSIILSNDNNLRMGDYVKGQAKKYKSKNILEQSLITIISNLHIDGYAESSIDTFYYEKNICRAKIHLGPKYTWGNISVLYKKELPGLDKIINQYRRKNFSSYSSGDMTNNIITHLANNSYPFASISLKHISFNDSIINSYWNISANNKYVWDSIIVKGNSKLNKDFLYPYLSLYKGGDFSESLAQSIDSKLLNLPFVKLIKPSEFEFDSSKSRSYLYLDKRKVNQFDGIVGLFSDKKTGKINLTGELNLKLLNSFSRGEKLEFNWKKLEQSSQKLKILFSYPFILKTKLGLTSQFELYKQDTSFLKTDILLKANIFFSGLNNINVFYKSESSALLSSKSYANATVLPSFVDSDMNLIGLGYEFSVFDYIFNPRKGYSIDCNLSYGKRTIEKNKNINPLLYKDLIMEENLMFVNSDINFYIPLYKDFILHLRNKISGSSSADLFENEQVKLGGLKSLRGFDEDFYKPQYYSLLNVELKFIPEKNTSLYLFYDIAYAKFSALQVDHQYIPYSLGFGVNFSTKQGIFSLNYAVGKYQNEGLAIDNAKVHFGFISRF